MSIEKTYKIQKPIKDNGWNIFPGTTLSNLRSSDCDNTIDGLCTDNVTLPECIQKCSNSPNCNFGYYISNLKGPVKSTCVPLQDLSLNINPSHRIRNKNIYPEFKNAQSTTFMNNKWKFPPTDANNIFFTDNFILENIETSFKLKKSTSKSPVFSKNGHLQTQLLYIPTNYSGSVQYIMLKYGEEFALNIPSTNLVIINNESTTFSWLARKFSLSDIDGFVLKPIKNKKKGDNVLYSDVFSIWKDGNIVSLENNHLVTKYVNNYEIAKKNGYNVTFRFIPKMKGWYCDDEQKCKEIDINKMTVNEKGLGIVNGSTVSRMPYCLGLCNQSSNSSNSINLSNLSNKSTNLNSGTVIITIITVIIIVIITILLVKYL
jgi:hypothetical protein